MAREASPDQREATLEPWLLKDQKGLHPNIPTETGLLGDHFVSLKKWPGPASPLICLRRRPSGKVSLSRQIASRNRGKVKVMIKCR